MTINLFNNQNKRQLLALITISLLFGNSSAALSETLRGTIDKSSVQVKQTKEGNRTRIVIFRKGKQVHNFTAVPKQLADSHQCCTSSGPCRRSMRSSALLRPARLSCIVRTTEFVFRSSSLPFL